VNSSDKLTSAVWPNPLHACTTAAENRLEVFQNYGWIVSVFWKSKPKSHSVFRILLVTICTCMSLLVLGTSTQLHGNENSRFTWSWAKPNFQRHGTQAPQVFFHSLKTMLLFAAFRKRSELSEAYSVFRNVWPITCSQSQLPSHVDFAGN